MPASTTPEVVDIQHAFTAAAAAEASSAQEPASPATVPATPSLPPTAPEPATVPQATPAPPVAAEPQAVSALAQAAQRAGVTTTGLSDEQIAAAMADTIVRTRPYATYGQQMAPYADQIRQYFEQQTTPPQPSAEPAAQPNESDWDSSKYFAGKWPAPKWDETYNFAISQGMVQRNTDTGLYEPVPGYEQMVLELLPGLNRATTFTAQQWQQITRGNPYQQFYEVLEEPLRHAWQEDIRQIVREHLEQQAMEQRVNSFESDNANWLYTTDPQTGTRVPSAKGQEFYNEIAGLQKRGIVDPQTLIDLASRLVGAGAPHTPAPAPTTGVPPLPAPPVPPQVASAQQTSTFLQTALERAAHAPSAGGFTQVLPDQPVTVSEVQLNNMFTEALRETQGMKV